MERYIIIILLGSLISAAYLVFISGTLMILGALTDVNIINNDTIFNLVIGISILFGGADAHQYYIIEENKTNVTNS